ncbi:LacI family DNA-binding transcriptional regulator [Paenibacillus sp. HW567]|uniref:LacI family DNA-binding transcriptional regulator n=1 Tax=Paenibacillus sp. HW567 TaxID=1034769 RepID=UPI00035E5087|nr:LacI family DNA-binding transcriptional regulator [Paenibacillus sp. HW567]
MSKKRVTSHDVARLAGVSRSVVSAVLNDTPGIGVSAETRENVLAAIRELNYHVDAQARSMKTGRSMSLAAFGDTRHPLFMRLLEGMQSECEAHGYHILLCSPGHRPDGEAREELVDLYHQRKIDGIVTLDSTSYHDEVWAAKVSDAGVPYVSVEGYAETEGVCSVLADYKGSVQLALDYLMREGALQLQAPLYAEVYHDGVRSWAERTRRDAYTGWCSERGMSPFSFRLPERKGRVKWEEWLMKLTDISKPAPPLLVNWSSGIPDLYRAAHKLGLRIGEDLRVMAADNTIQGHRLSLPSLSCVEIPYVGMGEEAVRRVLKQIDGSTAEEAAGTIWLPAVLRAGESA